MLSLLRERMESGAGEMFPFMIHTARPAKHYHWITQPQICCCKCPWWPPFVLIPGQCSVSHLGHNISDSPWSIRSPQWDLVSVLWDSVYLISWPTVAEAWSQPPTFHDPSAQHNGLRSATEVWMCNDAALRRIPQQPFLCTFRRCNKAVSINHHHF